MAERNAMILVDDIRGALSRKACIVGVGNTLLGDDGAQSLGVDHRHGLRLEARCDVAVRPTGPPAAGTQAPLGAAPPVGALTLHRAARQHEHRIHQLVV